MSTTLFETHVYFGWFLDPHLTTLRLNIGDQLREVIERCQHTLCGPTLESILVQEANLHIM